MYITFEIIKILNLIESVSEDFLTTLTLITLTNNVITFEQMGIVPYIPYDSLTYLSRKLTQLNRNNQLVIFFFQRVIYHC